MTRVALMTGGSRGIGAATAAMLRDRDWNVLVLRRSDADLVFPARVAHWTNKNPFERLDAMLLCAGEWFSHLFSEQWLSAYCQSYDVAVRSSVVLLQAYLPALKAAGGCVVAVASTRGFIGGVDTAPYSAAKAAQIALIQGFAREYKGVRFNAVCPGLTDTDIGREVIRTGGANADAVPQPPSAVAAEIVRLIESEDNGRVMRIVDGKATEAKWNW